jgi:putative acetyltransferase
MIRTAMPKDIEGLLNVSAAAFNQKLKKGSKKWNEEKERLSKDLKQWRIMLDNGKITGGVHVKKDWLRIGKAKILKGDVGGVCILPELQGKGLGTLILRDTLEWMKKSNYDLSRLGGLCKYYSRFGYKRFPRRYYEFNVGTLARAGASRVVEGEILLDSKLLNNIRPFDPAEDHEASLKLSEKFNRLYNGSRILTAVEKKPSAPSRKKNPLDLVYEENGRIIGHIYCSESEEEISDFEARIRIYLHGYEKKKPYVIQALLAYINNYALKKEIKRMTVRMPFDSDIIQALAELPFRFKTIETYNGISGNMLQIVNLTSLLSRIRPELQQRLDVSAKFSWSGVLQLKIEKDSAMLRVEKGKISVVTAGKVDAVISITEVQLLSMVLGIMSFSELDISQNEHIPTEIKIILNSLFPRKLTSSVNWG